MTGIGRALGWAFLLAVPTLAGTIVNPAFETGDLSGRPPLQRTLASLQR